MAVMKPSFDGDHLVRGCGAGFRIDEPPCFHDIAVAGAGRERLREYSTNLREEGNGAEDERQESEHNQF